MAPLVPRLRCPADAAPFFIRLLAHEPVEVFAILCLNIRRQAIGWHIQEAHDDVYHRFQLLAKWRRPNPVPSEDRRPVDPHDCALPSRSST